MQLTSRGGPTAALILAMLLWSSAFIVLKNLLAVWGPAQVIFGRMLVASLCFVLLWPYWRRITYQAGDWRWLLLSFPRRFSRRIWARKSS